MGGFGTIFAEGLAGAMAGAGQGAADQALIEQKEQMQALRDKRLSDLKTQEYRDQLSAQVASAPQLIAAQTPGLVDRARQLKTVDTQAEAAKPRVIPAGSTLLTPGTQPAVSGFDDAGDALDTSGNVIPPNAGTPDKMFTAPTKLSPGQEDYYTAHAAEARALTARYQAEADAINNGTRYNSQNQRPKVTLLDKDQGLLKDENTGAIGYVIPGKPGKAAVSHTFGADEPAVPATMPKTVWFDPSGKPLANGLDDLYPNRAKATAASGTPPATAAKAQSLGGYNGTSPPKKYPNAIRAPDGFWYVKNANGQFQLVLGQ